MSDESYSKLYGLKLTERDWRRYNQAVAKGLDRHTVSNSMRSLLKQLVDGVLKSSEVKQLTSSPSTTLHKGDIKDGNPHIYESNNKNLNKKIDWDNGDRISDGPISTSNLDD